MELILDPEEYDQFVPQDGYFNLLTSNDDFGNLDGCKQIQEDGSLANATCGPKLVNYICKSG